MSRRIKVLYLSYEGMTDPLGQSQVLSYMSGMSPDYEVTIVSCEKQERYQKQSADIKQICEQAGINWQPFFFSTSPPGFATIYNIWKMYRKARQVCSNEDVQIVHCRSYITSLIGMKMKKKFNSKFIFDMRGFWIDEKIEAGYWKTSNFFYRAAIKYLRKKEKQFYNQADAIVSLTHAAGEAITKMHPVAAPKLFIVPTCVNLGVFKPFDDIIRRTVRKEMGIVEDSFVLLYSGGYGANYDIGFLKTVFYAIKKFKENVSILVLSKDGVTGLENDDLNKHVYSISLPYNKVGNYLMAGDIGIINYVNHFSVLGRSPTKLAEYWASGLPAIAPGGIGDVDYLFTTYTDSGIIYNPDSLEKDINTMLPSDKQKLREYAEDYFSLAKGIKSYKSLYKYLIEKI